MAFGVVCCPSVPGRLLWLALHACRGCCGLLLGSWLAFRPCGSLWLSEALVALFGSVGLLWLVGSPCGSLARSTLAEALVVGFPECSCKLVVTLLHPQKRSISGTFPRDQILQDEVNTLPETKKNSIQS